MKEETLVFPRDTKRLYACLRCHNLRNFDQFQNEGCINGCPNPNTTERYYGMVCLATNKEDKTSWVKRYLQGRNEKVGDLKPGVYAIKVYTNDEEEDLGEEYDDDVDDQDLSEDEDYEDE